MDLRAFSGLALAAGLFFAGATAAAQEPAPAPTPAATPAAPMGETAASPAPTGAAAPTAPAARPAVPANPRVAPGSGGPSSSPPAPSAQRLSDPPSVRIETLPAENPFGLTAEAPAALPPKPVFTDQVVEEPLYASVRVDRTGKPGTSRRARDPIPSLAAETKKSFDRWVFEPGRRGGQPVDSSVSVRIDLRIEVKAPKIEQITLTPVTPASPLPAPLDWRPDSAWYDSLPAAPPPTDGSVAVEQLESLAIPKKTKWDADSYRGPFSVRVWVHITAAGKADRSIPIQASDPVLLSDFRRQIGSWQFRPARVNGQPVDSWAELVVSGQIGYSVDVKQIANLRKSLPELSATAP
ncbi:MAG: hypothetical protein LC780_13755 [Acidobacteria bacterium]|nr:hypothetical protein [Acidobacteriota bacterium]